MPTYRSRTNHGTQNTLHPFYAAWSTKVHYIVLLDRNGNVRGLPDHILNKSLLSDVEKLASLLRENETKAIVRLDEIETKFDEVKATHQRTDNDVPLLRGKGTSIGCERKYT
mmetsp:Transcript_24268/g.33931  ORF Transcript_24268/g.33931 Transcript_24268/m.33931 type:complete len:112 (+) Transcript_24268:69-404(+)